VQVVLPTDEVVGSKWITAIIPFTLFTSRTCESLCAAQDENDYRVLSATNNLHAACCHFKVRLITPQAR